MPPPRQCRLTLGRVAGGGLGIRAPPAGSSLLASSACPSSGSAGPSIRMQGYRAPPRSRQAQGAYIQAMRDAVSAPFSEVRLLGPVELGRQDGTSAAIG